MMIKRIIVTSLIGVLIFALLLTPLSYAWLANSLNKNTQIESYVHKSYFESGDGKTAAQFIDGNHGDDQSNCAFEIKYPVQLYYFAWLQALGYFNIPSNGAGTPISPVYFYLSEDLDMTGWVLPQIGTQTYPFVGNFDGNGHTVSNLTVQNIESSDSTIWNDKPSNITGLNIVGMFGVIGSIGGNTVNAAIANNDAFTPTAGYKYSSGTNEVKNFVLDNAVIKTDLSDSLAGMAAGYVNGTMENVKVVGGTLHSTATSSLSYTTNLSDYAAVGYCTANYRDSNNVVTVLIYDPQVYTNAEGSALGQGNNWGNSINMKSMYEDILAVYNDYGTDIDEESVEQKIITVNKTDGEVSSVTVTGSGESPLSTGNYTLKVVEKKDGSDTVAYFNLVDRNTNFMYLYGGKTYITKTIEKDSFYIHDSTSSHYFSINANAQITDVGSSSTATKWIIENNKIYTILTKTTTDPESQATSTEDWFYYVIKDNNNQLQIVEVSQREETPSSVTSSPWTVETDSITTGGYALVYKTSGGWQLEQAPMYITDNAGANYLSTNGATISNQTSSASASTWGKGTVENNATGFYLYSMVNGTKYYLLCNDSGILSIGTTNPTIWYEDSSNTKHKVYMLKSNSDSNGWALYYDTTNGWSTTGYSKDSQGSDWGGSVNMRALNQRLFALLNSGNVTYSAKKYGNNYGVWYKDSSNWISSIRGDNVVTYYANDPDSHNVIYNLVGKGTSTYSYTNGFVTPGTVLPLLVDDDFNVLSGNTGYIVSGSASLSTNGGTIRSASYNLRFISNSLDDVNKTNLEVYEGGYDISYDKSKLEILTNSTPNYNANNFVLIKDDMAGYNQNHTPTASSAMYGMTKNNDTTPSSLKLTKYNDSRQALDTLLDGSSYVHGIHFYYGSGVTISNSNTITFDTAVINGSTYTNYPLPLHTIDFHLKDSGKINFFAGSYYSISKTAGSAADSFFTLYEINRNGTNISSIKRIDYIYKNTEYSPSNLSSTPYVYQYQNGSKPSNAGELVFDMRYLWNEPPVKNALYYFEIPVNSGEYAMGCVSGKTGGAYLMYLDISASGAIEGDSKILEGNTTITNHTDSGKISYKELEPSANEKPTYFPLAWSRYGEGNAYDYRGDLPANTNTGYVISGSNSTSNPPGDIRVSRYSKYANGNWASIRASLTSTDAAGILDNAKVYTIVNGVQRNINSYGIGIIHTMQYGSVSKTVNELLNGNEYVYGLHFMQSTISKDKTVTVPKAIINETTYTNYVMPQDCIDFKVSSKGRVAFMAGTYFSGSSGVQSFFSLHRIFRDGSNNITSIKQLSEVYSDGNAANGYIYRYQDDTNYYNAEGTSVGGSVPSGYVKVYDLKAIDDPGSLGISLTQNSVYYFEIPVDAGEYALGSSNSDGAYLIYLDIAAGADYAVQTTTTEVSVQKEYTNNYPKGVAFVDAYNSTVFDTEGEADPSKSVFMSIPVGAASNGNTTFSIDSNGNMTVINSSSTLSGVTAQSIPMNGSLTVNNNDIKMTPSKQIIIEKVTTVLLDMAGTTTTTVTTTTQTTIDGVTTTEVVQTVTTEFNGSTNTTTTAPAPTYDGHDLIPDDLTSQTNPKAKADTILEFIYTATGVNTTSERTGDVNIVETQYTITVNGQLFTVYDVVKDSNANPVVYGATYNITLSGAANVTITKYNNDFAFSINGNAVTQESQSISVTNP